MVQSLPVAGFVDMNFEPASLDFIASHVGEAPISIAAYFTFSIETGPEFLALVIGKWLLNELGRQSFLIIEEINHCDKSTPVRKDL